MLEEMGIDCEVIPPNIDEKAIRLHDPRQLVLALAHAKADALVSRISEPAYLITSDQVVVYQGEIREKPENEIEARAFLESYDGSFAETVTSVVVTDLVTGKRAEGVDIAKVYFTSFSQHDIEELILDGRVFHIAGGFSIDGEKWVDHIDRIEGTRDSVLGLPKEMTSRLMQEVRISS